MKKHIMLIIVFMSLCSLGVVGLQLFWNYQNYRTTVKTFDHDINEALNTAVNKEADERREQIVNRFKGWLGDTSLITVTADHNNRDSATVFYTQDTHPKFNEDKKRKFSFGLSDFRQTLDHITPGAKATMIEHFADRILKRDLEEGMVYHYTQMLGDSLEKVFKGSKVSLGLLDELLKKELAAKDISASFSINPQRSSGLYLTKTVNTNFRKPYQSDWVYAGFENPNVFFVKEMKWVIITSSLLILITIACYTYTVSVLVSQDRLAELKDNFINNMTHELNTPITSIKITTEALKTFNHSPQTQREYLDMISYQSNKLQDLTTHILNAARGGKDNNDPWRDININELVAGAINDLKPQSEYMRATIFFKPHTGDLFIYAQVLSIRNAIVNLIDNALKYAVERPEVCIEVQVASANVSIKVSDNGIGIPKEYHASVFDRFFRVPKGNVHDIKGFGLGLSYVKAVMKLHHGDVTVSKNDPSGTIFNIQLPLKG